MLMEKINVNGPEAHSVYRFLKANTDKEPIDWNFAKYLCDREGNCKHYTSSWNPSALTNDIENILKKN